MQKEAEHDIAYDPELIVRYIVAPGTKVLLMGECDEQLHLDPVHWGYAPGWWDKPMLIYARVGAVSASRRFKSLCLQEEDLHCIIKVIDIWI
nr:MAG TPA_asm: Tubulinyl-Tyr carboxypeptidase 1 [Caudoviricetes sp.]